MAPVAGASRGVGHAIAVEFTCEGADVVANYRKEAAVAEQVATEIHPWKRFGCPADRRRAPRGLGPRI
jgi:NAD(P)-dependent dehydrogenase (short-subunit alcohol dehydrogenase family)